VSYDLFFRSRRSTPLSRKDFEGYFNKRNHYKVENKQAWYFNEDTEVYFGFDFVDSNQESGADESSSYRPVVFNMNYFRPHAFGLEAEPEVAAFVAHFDLTVSDPQTSGMGDGDYTKDGFLRGWNAGNEFGYLAITTHDSSQQYLALPASIIDVLWQWNYRRDERQNALGQTVFVPRILFLEHEGKVKTTVAWGDGIPILLPEVDVVIVPRQTLAPRRWLKSVQDIVVFSWTELARILRGYQCDQREILAFRLFYDQIPYEIEKLIRDKSPPDEKPRIVTFDQILDHETLETAREKSKRAKK